jgi:hypothetical protein
MTVVGFEASLSGIGAEYYTTVLLGQAKFRLTLGGLLSPVLKNVLSSSLPQKQNKLECFLAGQINAC